jgi:hypothetical protein
MKRVMIAGVGTLMLLGSAYGIQNVSAAGNPQTFEAKVATVHVGKRVEVLSQFKDKIHQVNQLREERLDIKKQIVEKKDTLLDLLIAAKTSENKEDLKQANEAKKQIKAINAEMKTLATVGKDERRALKEAVKKGEGSEQFTKLIATQQQMNKKMKVKLGNLDKMIELLN